MTRGITLTREQSARVLVANRGDAFRLRVTASAAEGLDNEIFIHQRLLSDPEAVGIANDYVCVCTPYDLTIYPKNDPDVSQFPPFFRLSVIDILLPTSAAVEEAWIAIRSDVDSLLSAMARLSRMTVLETMRLGDPITEEPA